VAAVHNQCSMLNCRFTNSKTMLPAETCDMDNGPKPPFAFFVLVVSSDSVHNTGISMLLGLLIVVLGAFYGAYGASWSEASGYYPGYWRGIHMSDEGQYACAATKEGFIFYSSDYGQSWALSNAPGNIHWVYLDGSASGQYVVASAQVDNKVYYSSDYGQTWTASNTPISEWQGAGMSASGQYAIVSEIGTDRHIWYSSDYGHTYTQGSSPSGWWTSVDMDSTGQYAVAAALNAGVYYSTDYGHTWLLSTGIAASELSYGGRVTMGSDGGAIAIGGDSQLMYRSTNYGQTFALLNTAPSVTWSSMMCDATCTRIIAGGNWDVMYASSDGGVTWETSLFGQRWLSVAINSDGTRAIAAYSDGAGLVYYSSNVFAAYPTSQPSGLPTGQPSVLPSGQPTTQPSAAFENTFLASPTYRVSNGFAFAAVGAQGETRCWGEGPYGGNSTAVASFLAADVVRVTASRFAFAAVRVDGGIAPWGVSSATSSVEDLGAVTLSPDTLVASEGAFAGVERVTGRVIAFGSKHTGGNVLDDAYCNGYSQELSAGVRSITASAGAFAALKADGTVLVWGNRFAGADVAAGVLASLSGVRLVAATRSAFAALLADGSVVAWGDAMLGGDATAVAGQLSGVVRLSASPSCFVAFKADTSVVVWGYHKYCGDTSTVAADLASQVLRVTFTATAMAALKTDGSVVTWGKSENGGDSSAVRSSLNNVVRVVGNTRAFAALTATGGVVAWGSPTYGGSIPGDKVAALSSGVVSIYHTDRAFAALKDDGSLVVWGQERHGGSPSSAVEALLTPDVHTVCANDVAFSAIKADGSVVAWGHEVSVPEEGVQFTTTAFQGSVTCA
jgi:alpha-tubulin suppressor-like RCC1 family protein